MVIKLLRGAPSAAVVVVVSCFLAEPFYFVTLLGKRTKKQIPLLQQHLLLSP